MIKRLSISILILVIMSFYTVEKFEKIEAHTLSDVKVVSMMSLTTDKLAQCVEVDSIVIESELEIEPQTIESLQSEIIETSSVQTKPLSPEGNGEFIEEIPKMDSGKSKNQTLGAPLSKSSIILPKERVGEKAPRSYDELVEIYYDQLKSIQNASQESVVEMVEMAKTEYDQAEDDIKYTLTYKRELIIKYYDLANQMEAMVDDAVDAVLIKFQSELEAYGYTTSVVEQFRTEYEQQKDAKMKDLMDTTFVKVNDVN